MFFNAQMILFIFQFLSNFGSENSCGRFVGETHPC